MSTIITLTIIFLIFIVANIVYNKFSVSKRISNLKEMSDDLFSCAESVHQQINLVNQIKNNIKIPEKYEIGEDNLPKNKNVRHNWGKDFNIYLTPTGYKYHKLPHCSKNSYIANIAKASKTYKPCLICCKNYQVPELEWYVNYLQYLEEISKLKSLQCDMEKTKKELLSQRETLNNSFFNKLLEWSPQKRRELFYFDRIIAADIETLPQINIDLYFRDINSTDDTEADTKFVNPGKRRTTAQIKQSAFELDERIRKKLAEGKSDLHETIPNSISIGEDGLPYVKMREYGYGKRFNAFITKHSDCYHKSKCPSIRFHKKTVIHRYEAMKKYKPCSRCKPIDYVEEWYKHYLDQKK